MSVKPRVAESLTRAPIIGVVRTHDHEEAARVARSFIDAGLELVEITFTVPEATRLVETLRAERAQQGGDGPPWIGMGTVTTPSAPTAPWPPGRSSSSRRTSPSR